MEWFLGLGHGCAGCDKQSLDHTVCTQLAEGSQQARRDRLAYLQAIANGDPIPVNSATIGTWTEGGPAANHSVVFEAVK